MLSQVKRALVEAGAVSPSSRLLQNVTLTGSTISLDVYDPGRTWFHVKASRHSDFGNEFASYQLARERFGELVAEPIACTHLDGWSILIARSVDHTNVGAHDLMAESPSCPLIADLIRFLDVARTTTPGDPTNKNHSKFMQAVHRYFADADDVPAKVVRHLERTSSAPWAALPYIPQHGDFVLNNLGRVGNRLIIFDWEDYGATGLAGFDICLMGLSIAGMNIATIERMLRAESPRDQPWPLTARACAVSGIDCATFRASIPAYLIAFRYFKRNYGSGIRRRVNEILAHVLR